LQIFERTPRKIEALAIFIQLQKKKKKIRATKTKAKAKAQIEDDKSTRSSPVNLELLESDRGIC
jgi:hypothetical protein